MTAQLLSSIAPQFLQALSQGYNVRNVIDWLMKNNKNVSKQIKEALKQGYSYDDIGEYLTKGKSRSYSQQQAMLTGMTEKEKGERIANYQFPTERRVIQNLPKIAGVAALTALAPMALRYALPSAIQPSAILPALPQQAQIGLQSQAQRGLPHIAPKAPVNNQAQPQAPIVPPTVQAQAKPLTPSPAKAPQTSASQILNNFPQIKNRVDTLIEAGNAPDIISKVAQSRLTPEEKNALKQVQEPFESIINRYISEGNQAAQQPAPSAPEAQAQPSSATQEPIITPEKDELAPQEENIPEDFSEAERVQPIRVKETVILPSGDIGSVKATNNKNAIVNIDGKDRQIKIDELEISPLNNDELADLYDNLFAKIPEEHKSAFISWAGYDENRNTLGFIPRGGKYEEIGNVPPEYAQAIKDATGQARTSGEKREGLWIAGQSTRGGLIYNLIEKIKKEKEATKARQPEFGFTEEIPEPEKTPKGMIPIFDELAFARQQSRDRDKRLREQEKMKKKAEKQKEKDAEKARKKAKKQA